MPCSTDDQTPEREEPSRTCDLGRASALVHRLQSTNDSLEAVDLLSDAASCLGASSAVFISVTSEPKRSTEDCRMLLACDPIWAAEAEAAEMLESNPWLRHAATRTEPIRGSDLVLESLEDRAFVDMSARFGFASTVIFPAPSANGIPRQGMLCLGSDTPSFIGPAAYLPVKVIGRAIAMELAEWWRSRVADEWRENIGLTQKDLDLLALEKRGISSKGISRRLGISTSAVDSRYKRLNIKLGVPNRKVAATLASLHGLL